MNSINAEQLTDLHLEALKPEVFWQETIVVDDHVAFALLATSMATSNTLCVRTARK